MKIKPEPKTTSKKALVPKVKSDIDSKKIKITLKNFLKPIPKIFLICIFTVSTILFSQYITSPLFSLLANERNINLISALYSAFSYSLSVVIIIFLPQKIHKKWKTSREDLGLKGFFTFTDFGLAPIAFVAFMILSSVATNIFTNFEWFNMSEQQNVGFTSLNSAPEKILAYVSLCIVAPIAEEIIFRGWLYGKLRKKINGKTSIIFSSLIVSIIFGILHGQWNVGVTVFSLSLIMCITRELTGTIYSGILIHMLKNIIAFLLVYVTKIR